MKTKLSPSMLSIDFGKVAEQLKLVEDAGTQYIHLDVMDGKECKIGRAHV